MYNGKKCIHLGLTSDYANLVQLSLLFKLQYSFLSNVITSINSFVFLHKKIVRDFWAISTTMRVIMKVRKIGVSTQIFIMITCLVMGTCGIIGVTLYNQTVNLLIAQSMDSLSFISEENAQSAIQLYNKIDKYKY